MELGQGNGRELLTSVNVYVNLLYMYEIAFYRTASQECPIEEFWMG